MTIHHPDRKRMKLSKPVRPALHVADDDDFIDDEDFAIAELEKKLGIQNRKKSKLGDEELDGSFCFYVLNEGLLDGIGKPQRGMKRKANFDPDKASKYQIAQAKDATHDQNNVEDDQQDSDDDTKSKFKGFSNNSESLE